MKCDFCGNRYRPENIQILERRGKQWFLRIFCPTCAISSLITLTFKEITPQQTHPHLIHEQIEPAHAYAPVTIDDVLDMHNLLAKSDADLAALMNETN